MTRARRHLLLVACAACTTAAIFACSKFEDAPGPGDAGSGIDGSSVDGGDAAASDGGSSADCEGASLGPKGCAPWPIASNLRDPLVALDQPLAIAVSETHVFVGDRGVAGGVVRLIKPGEKDTKTADKIFVGGAIGAVALTGANLFFTRIPPGGLLALTKSAKSQDVPATALGTGKDAIAVATGASYVYALSGASLATCSPDFTDPIACSSVNVTLANATHVSAGGDDYCIAANIGGIGSGIACGRGANQPSLISSIDPGNVSDLVARGGRVFWADAATLYIQDVSGGTVTKAAIADITHIAVDQDDLFYSVRNAIFRCPKTNCTTLTSSQLTEAGPNIDAIAAGTNHVYFTYGGGTASTIARVPRP